MNKKEMLFLAALGSGLLPKAPGTWGSIVGALSGSAILLYFPIDTLFLLTILITVIAIKHIDIYEKRTGIHDDKRVVIDEVAGMWLALCLSGGTVLATLLSFIFFRIYDIWKPSLIGKIDKKFTGGLGVMGDDLIAGLAAGLSSALMLLALEYIGLIG